jgi:dGTPase
VLAPFDAEDRRRFQEVAPPAARDTDDRPNHGKPLHKSLDATITELADDIAYGVHDLEDAIALRLVPQEMLLATWAEHAKTIAQFRGAPAENDIRDLFKSESARKRAIGLLVNFFIIHVRLHRQGRFMHPLLDSQANLDTEARGFLMALSKLVMEQVILRPSAQMVEFRGQLIVQRIFETIAADPGRFLDQRYLCVWREAADERGRLRTVCDCIAAMTDEYATRVYERLFVPRARSAFEPD